MVDSGGIGISDVAVDDVELVSWELFVHADEIFVVVLHLIK